MPDTPAILTTRAELPEQLDGAHVADVLDGPHAGHVIYGAELPERYTITEADDNGGTVRSAYMLGEHGYRFAASAVTPGAPERSTAIDPQLGERFKAAGIRAAAAALPELPDVEPEPPIPEPAAARLVFVICGGCRGSGAVVVAEPTGEFRRQGYPYTVTAPCGACRGSGGLLTELPDIG